MIVNCRIIDKIIAWDTTVLFSGTKLTGITRLSHTSTASERTVFSPRVLILRLFVLQARQTSRRRWVWRIDKMILKVGNTEVLGKKNSSQRHFVRPKLSHALTWDRKRVSAVWGRRLQSVPHSQDIPYRCCSTRKWSQFIVRISRSMS